jgi:hypothetical protein
MSWSDIICSLRGCGQSIPFIIEAGINLRTGQTGKEAEK